MLGRGEFDDFSSLLPDGRCRVFFFLDMKTTLEHNRFPNRLFHSVFQFLRPGVKRWPVQEYGAGKIEMVRSGMKVVVFVHSIRNRVRKWVFLRVESSRRNRRQG